MTTPCFLIASTISPFIAAMAKEALLDFIQVLTDYHFTDNTDPNSNAS